LGHSLNWHRREAKSEWWEYYRKGTLTDEQLMADPESIGGLEFRGEVRQEKQSNIFRYYFDPTQEYKVAVGDKPHDPRRLEGAGDWQPRRSRAAARASRWSRQASERRTSPCC